MDNLKRIIRVDFGDSNSVKEAVRVKAMLENKGFNLVTTAQTGLGKFMLIYKRA